jgi:TolA-binding protein
MKQDGARQKAGNQESMSATQPSSSIPRVLLRWLGGLCLLAMLSATFISHLGAQEKGKPSDPRAVNYFSDAAGFYNKGAYKLAIDEWRRLLTEYPQDPLASQAWHYTGVALTQIEQPDYAAAIEAFENALKDPQFERREEALSKLCWCLFTEARTAPAGSNEQRVGLEKARERLREFLKSYGDSGDADQALYFLGEIEYSLGDAKRSIPYYKKLLETDSMRKSKLRSGSLYAIGIAYEEVQQEPLAVKSFRQFLDEFPNDRLAGEVDVRLADLLLKQGKAEEAVELLKKLPQGSAAVEDYALLRLGSALSALGKPDEAAETYKKLLRQFSDSKHANTAALLLGQILSKSGRADEAIAEFEKVIGAKDAQAAEAAHALAVTLLDQGKPREAVTMLEDALTWSQDAPTATSLQMDYADALYALPGELERAREAYAKIVTDHPNDPLAPRAAYNAAFAALQGGQIAEAQKWSELFLNRFPQDPLRNDVAAIAADALLQQGEHQAAAKAFAQLRDVDPQNPAINQWTLRLAMAYYLAGEYPSATRLLESDMAQLASDAEKAEAQFILGASYLYDEKTAAAIEQLTASHRTSDRWPSADEVLLMLAEAHQRNNDNQAALQTLQKLVEKYPNTRLKSQVDYKLAQLTAALGKYDQAIARYEAIVTNDASSSYKNFANYGIVWCLMQQEDYAQALVRLQPLLDQQLRDSIGAEAKLAEGVCLRKLGRVEEALESLESFLLTKPSGTSLANGLYELGLAATQQGQLDRASEYFERILRDVPDYPALDKVLYELAWNQQENADQASAVRYFEQLAQRFPDSTYRAEALYMLAQSQYDGEQFDKAAETYASVLEQAKDASLREKSQYKLGWSLFQQARYPQAAAEFAEQASQFAAGTLAVDGLFMNAECAFKQEQYEQALSGYKSARQTLEAATNSVATDQVRALIYLHGAQCYRELGRWDECAAWLNVIMQKYPKSPYLWTAVYELGYCKQKQEDIAGALKFYSQVVDNNRNELGARARFMMGEVYFSQRDFRRAIEEFTRVAFGFGGDKAPDAIKNWQAKSAFEAARCYEVLVSDLRGDSRSKAVDGARKFYEEIVREHAQHELAAKASSRLGDLQKLR